MRVNNLDSRCWWVSTAALMTMLYCPLHLLPTTGMLTVPEASAADSCQGTLSDDADPPEVTIGERLFLETRFA